MLITIIICVGVEGVPIVIVVADRIAASSRQPHMILGSCFFITPNLGVASGVAQITSTATIDDNIITPPTTTATTRFPNSILCF